MPTNKDFKRLVRGRMRKTGESFTAARAVLLKKPARNASAPKPVLPDYAKLAGMSNAAIGAKTGRTWADWVDTLDASQAHSWPHRKIAEHVHGLGVGDWWSQTVTVGYERIKGLREIGQRRGGGYEAGRSKTVAVPVAELFRAFTEPRLRQRWLSGVKFSVRSATPNKYVRITWSDATAVDVVLIAKGAGKASAQVTHRKLADKEAVARLKAFWGERLEDLARLLERSG